MDRSWFDRVWPVQEVALCKSCIVMCGNAKMTWQELNTALSALYSLALPSDPYHKLHMHRKLQRVLWHYTRRHSMKRKCTSLLLHARYQRASDPKDKICAFHGVFEKLGAHLPSPSYATPVETIYREAAVAMMEHDQSIEIIRGATGSSTIAGLPSWVPDWADESPVSDALLWGQNKASRCSKPIYEFGPPEAALTLSGFRSGRVVSRSEAFPNIHELRQTHANNSRSKEGRLRAIEAFRAWFGYCDAAFQRHDDSIESRLRELNERRKATLIRRSSWKPSSKFRLGSLIRWRLEVERAGCPKELGTCHA